MDELLRLRAIYALQLFNKRADDLTMEMELVVAQYVQAHMTQYAGEQLEAMRGS